jgi:Leucine Rich repeat
VLQTVTALDLAAGNGVGDEGVAQLARCPYLGNLASLDLAVGRLGPKGVKALADGASATNLVRLNLRDNAIRKAGVDLLADPQRWPRLLRLDLQRAVQTNKLKATLTARFGSGVRFYFH